MRNQTYIVGRNHRNLGNNDFFKDHDKRVAEDMDKIEKVGTFVFGGFFLFVGLIIVTTVGSNYKRHKESEILTKLVVDRLEMGEISFQEAVSILTPLIKNKTWTAEARRFKRLSREMFEDNEITPKEMASAMKMFEFDAKKTYG